jgi:hypothetical protein
MMQGLTLDQVFVERGVSGSKPGATHEMGWWDLTV